MSFTSAFSVAAASTRKLGSPGGIVKVVLTTAKRRTCSAGGSVAKMKPTRGIAVSRRVFVRAKYADGLARLNQQRLVVFEALQRAHYLIERAPIARRPSRPAVDDQLVRLLCHFRVKVVHQHAERCFLMPSLATDLAPARR